MVRLVLLLVLLSLPIAQASFPTLGLKQISTEQIHSPTTGTFSVTDPDLLDSTEPIGTVTRPAIFSGVIAQRLTRGVRHFLLPERPDQALETVAKAPFASGKVSLEGND